MTRLISVLVALVIYGIALADSNGDSRPLLQKPTLSQTHIVFVHAGDLWSVSRSGGEAKRLTVGAGLESNPVFSPDGSKVAFNGEYDGNVDVFVMPAAGGVPKRLTWHPGADIVMGWAPDGKRVLFASSRTSYTFVAEFFTVDLDGRFPQKSTCRWVSRGPIRRMAHSSPMCRWLAPLLRGSGIGVDEPRRSGLQHCRTARS